MSIVEVINTSEIQDFDYTNLSSEPSFSALHQLVLFDDIPNNHSFLIKEDDEIIAACPLLVENKTINDEDFKVGSMFNLSLPGPLIFCKDAYTKNNIKNIVKKVLQTIEDKSQKNSISKIQYHFSDIGCWQNISSFLYKELHRKHYLDVSLLYQRVDISNTPDIMMKLCSKGHRAILKKIKLKVEFQSNIELELSNREFKKKMNVYDLDESKIKYFFNLYQNNRLEFCNFFISGEEVGNMVFLKNNRDVSYYLSHKNDAFDLPIHHIGLWEAMKKYHFEGYQYLDLGIAFFGNSINYVPSAKQLGITVFKSGFGGEVCPFIRFEKYFDKKLYEYEQNLKVNNYKQHYFNV